MTRLSYLHEPGVLQNLRARYELNEIYVSTTSLKKVADRPNALLSQARMHALSHVHRESEFVFLGGGSRMHEKEDAVLI